MPEKTRKPAKPKRRRTHYTDEERRVILAQLAANGYNYSRTESETGVARSTLMRWAENPPDGTAGATEIDTLKKELQEAYLDKAKRVREILLDRIAVVAESEKDLFKLSGAFKTVADATSDEEVNRALANRINAAQAQATAGAEAPRISGSADSAFN